jgi:AcrR family transcriptional regulator
LFGYMAYSANTSQQRSELKRSRVLEAAREVFLAYGFERATMNDIARAAGISRPALYLQFRDKRDIYRALVSELVERELRLTKTFMAEDRPLTERVERSFASLIKLLQEIEEWPHGRELFAIENELVSDIILQARNRMVQVLREAMAREAEAKRCILERCGLTVAALAELLLDAFAGLKRRGPSNDEHRSMMLYVRAVTGPFGR